MTTHTRPRERADTSPEGSGRPAGRMVVGALLVLFGLLWLLDVAGVFELRWRVVLPAALTAVGIGLLATARRGASGGLIATGIVLSVLVLLSAVLPGTTPLAGIGDQIERPSTAAEAEDGYELGMGTLTVDLTTVEGLSDGTVISASVGMGELVVELPDGVGADVRASAGMGEATVLDRSRGGVGVTLDDRVDGTPTIVLDVSVGMGSVEVRQ